MLELKKKYRHKLNFLCCFLFLAPLVLAGCTTQTEVAKIKCEHLKGTCEHYLCIADNQYLSTQRRMVKLKQAEVCLMLEEKK